jgi:hypothetical protein
VGKAVVTVYRVAFAVYSVHFVLVSSVDLEPPIA